MHRLEVSRLISPCLFLMASNSTAVTSQLPVHGGPGDESFWEGYLNRVIDDDTRLISNWRKILDTLLVYVRYLPRTTTLITNFNKLEIGWTLPRCLDCVSHSSIEFAPIRSRRYDQQDSRCDLQSNDERFLTRRH
jgi:hypothetical protein